MIDTLPSLVRAHRRRVFRRVVGKFSQRRHLPRATRSLDCVALVRVPALQTRASWYENIPVISWSVLLAKCRTCRAPISIRYPFVEALTSALFVLAGGSTVRAAACGPSRLRLRAHRALRDRSRASPAAQRDHPAGIVVGFAFSLVAEPGWMASLIGIAAGGGLLYLVAEVYYASATRKGSAWAIRRCWR